jgi:hypothetical protein
MTTLRRNRTQTRTNKGIYGPDIELLRSMSGRLRFGQKPTARQKRQFAEMWSRWGTVMP